MVFSIAIEDLLSFFPLIIPATSGRHSDIHLIEALDPGFWMFEVMRHFFENKCLLAAYFFLVSENQ